MTSENEELTYGGRDYAAELVWSGCLLLICTVRILTLRSELEKSLGGRMHDELTVETDLFNHKEVKPHFINPCCFGEDFAAWLLATVKPSLSGYELSEPIQEDYGWGFWARRGKDAFWIALSFVGEGPTEEPGEWVVSVNYDPGLNPLKRLFHKPDGRKFTALRDEIWKALKSRSGIKVVEGA